MNSSPHISIANCTVLSDENAVLFKDNQNRENKVSLQPKFIEVLCYLIEQYPRVIPRQELIDRIWSGNDYVGEKALTNAIWHLRKAFSDNECGEVIETIRKVGYKLSQAPVILEVEQQVNEATSQQKTQRRHFVTLFTFILVAAIYWVWHDVQEHQENKNVLIESITTEPGAELFVAPSPDGQKIVYAWTASSGIKNLYMRDISQPNLAAQQLTQGGQIQGISTWGLDGEHLYFVRKSRSQKFCHVIELNIKAKQERIITECPLSGGYYYLDVSYDGKTLAFHGNHDNVESGIYFVDLANNKPQPKRFSCLYDCNHWDRDFAFSPDGEKIAITRRTSRYSENIVVVDLRDKSEHYITENLEDIVGLSWHPSGQQLVYGYQKSDVRHGAVYDFKQQRSLGLEIDGFSYPQFAKVSAQLYFQQRKEHYHLASLNLEEHIASSPFPLLQSNFSHDAPHYSKVANKIAFTSNESGHYELWLTDPSGGERTKLTDMQSLIRYPKWSHNGRYISFLAPAKDKVGDNLYLYDMVKNRITVINTGATSHNRATWAWDDKSVISALTIEGKTELYRIPIQGGGKIKLTDNDGRFGVLREGNQLYYANAGGNLWHKSGGSNHEPQKVVDATILASPYTWVIEDNQLVYVKRYKGVRVLSILNLLSQQDKAILQFPTNTMSSSAALTFNPNTNTLYFPQSAVPQSDIKRLTHPLIN